MKQCLINEIQKTALTFLEESESEPDELSESEPEEPESESDESDESDELESELSSFLTFFTLCFFLGDGLEDLERLTAVLGVDDFAGVEDFFDGVDDFFVGVDLEGVEDFLVGVDDDLEDLEGVEDLADEEEDSLLTVAFFLTGEVVSEIGSGSEASIKSSSTIFRFDELFLIKSPIGLSSSLSEC